MKPNYSALNIASYFIGKGVSPLQLQKLLYYSQVWFYVKNRRLLFDDKIKAWIYGPVIPKVWDNFRYMKRSSIIPKIRAQEFDLKEVKNHLSDVWNAYGHLTGSNLVDLTHNELPWRSSRAGLLNDTPSNNVIPINRITTTDFKLDASGNIPVIPQGHSLGIYSNSFE